MVEPGRGGMLFTDARKDSTNVRVHAGRGEMVTIAFARQGAKLFLHHITGNNFLLAPENRARTHSLGARLG